METVHEWEGRTGPFSILLPPGVFPPSRTSRELADRLEVDPRDVVIDVGCGSGILGLVAARLGAARVYGTDVMPEAVDAAQRNARRLGVEQRVEFRTGNLLEPLAGVRADVVIGDVSGIPDALAEETEWFPGGHAGGPTGAEVPVAMVQATPEHLEPGGRLYLPTGTIQDEERILEVAREVFGERNMERLADREFPLPSAVAASRAATRLMREGLLRLRQRGSRLLWRLSIWRCIRR